MNLPTRCIPAKTRIFKSATASLLLLALAWTAISAQLLHAQGTDRIRRRSGLDRGKITEVTPLAVTISKGGVDSKVAVEEIRYVEWAGEPDELRSVRTAIAGRRFDDALSTLQEISRAAVERQEILQDLDYLQAVCQAELALIGQGELASATRQTAAFLKKHRRSYHFTAAIELLGNLYAAAGNQTAARSQYQTLAKAPAPYFKARSAILLGRSLQEENQHQKAIAEFDKALSAAKDSAVAKPLELEATLHRAVSKSAVGDIDQSTEVIKTIIAGAEAEDTTLLAQAYNALGDCYLQSGNQQAARDAFLHVDLLFSASADEHARALYELAQLWTALGHEARARDARQRLEEEYPGSRWAKRS